MDIEFTEKYGLANTIEGKIYLHPILNEYPDIKEKVIKHELEHQKAKGFLANRKIDALTEVKFKDLLPIYRKKPSLFFKQHSPVLKIDDTIFIEWSIIFLIIFYGCVLTLIVWIISLFSNDLDTAFLIVKYMLLIGGGIIIFYSVGKRLMKYINEESKKTTQK